jgi:hypothetical protein
MPQRFPQAGETWLSRDRREPGVKVYIESADADPTGNGTVRYGRFLKAWTTTARKFIKRYKPQEVR